MKRLFLAFSFFAVTISFSLAQSDSVRVMNEVVVTAYKSERPLTEVGAAVGAIDEKQIARFSQTSFVSVANMVPGVRMEERSPGSYRFAIRGSSLRSPFGVRNVKFYWNGLPLTDAGGNTYLNLIDLNAVGGMEIIKGPGASLYGAGTGGVVLLKNRQVDALQIGMAATVGSYGLQQYRLMYQAPFKKASVDATGSVQLSDGYRTQSAMSRVMTNVNVSFFPDAKNNFAFSCFASYLGYETPGGLTLAQYQADPRQARPGTATTPGAEEQKAAVFNRSVYLSGSHDIQWSKNLSTRYGIYFLNSFFENPTIRNFETRAEDNGGMRTETQYMLQRRRWSSRFSAGAEIQLFQSSVTVNGNDHGTKTAQVFSDDKLGAQTYLLFAQSDIQLPRQFFLTLGASASSLSYRDKQVLTGGVLKSNFDTEVSPRVSVLKKWAGISTYANISRGFSPPTFAEALPSTGVYNNKLNAERGVSYEIGARGQFLHAIQYDVSVYDFRLKKAIVVQRDADGADYFVNAGATKQQGIEAYFAWTNGQARQHHIKIWTSATINRYRFTDYVQNDVDYSGNPLTGVAPDILVGGIDIAFKSGIYTNVTTTYTDHMSLNDGATEYASDFLLLGGRVGYRLNEKRLRWDFFAGIDNALNETYSLGNDLNAIGARYYNAAAGRNFYAGISMRTGRFQ